MRQMFSRLFSHRKAEAIALNGQFLIQANKLKANNKLLIDEGLRNTLASKKIPLKLNVHDSGKSSQPTIVFIHGNSTSQKVFDEQKKYFSANYRVIAFDLLGHGGSTKIGDIDVLTKQKKEALSKALYNPFSIVAVVTHLLETKGIKKAHFIGWSLGGHIAYGVAVENPKLVASITSIGSPPIRFSKEGFKKGFDPSFVKTVIPKWINSPQKYSPQEADRIARDMGFNDDKSLAEDMMNADPYMRKFLFSSLIEHDASEYDETAIDGEHFVRSSSLPLCLIAGGKDGGINAEYIVSFQSQLKNESSRVMLIKDAPHAVLRTHSELICETMESFIQQVTSPARQFTH